MLIVFYGAFFSTENKESRKIRVSDLIQLPKIDPSTQKPKEKLQHLLPVTTLHAEKASNLLRKQMLGKKKRIKRRKNWIKLKTKQ